MENTAIQPEALQIEFATAAIENLGNEIFSDYLTDRQRQAAYLAAQEWDATRARIQKGGR